LAIYADQTMVGFIMYNDRPLDDGTYRISRVMIDHRYQGRGYARASVEQVIQRMRQIPDCQAIVLDYSPHNTAATHLYAALGFQVIEANEHEIVARLTW